MGDMLIVWFLVEPDTWDPLYLIPLAATTAALVSWAVAAGAWMVWQFQLHTYLEATTQTHLRFGRNSVWWWLAPVANLVVPPIAVRQLSVASRPDERPAPITLVWWIGWVATALGLILALSLGRSNRILLMVPVVGIAAVTALLAATVVSSITNSTQAQVEAAPVMDRVRPLHLLIATMTSAFLVALGSGYVFLMVQLASNPWLVAGGQPGFEVGTCFNEPFFDDVYEVDCGQPHDAEVYSVLTYPAEAYPGDDVLWNWADSRCLPEFERATGQEWVESDLDYWWFYPSETSWGEGDRTVQCYLVHLSGAQLIGSMISGSAEPESNA
jgi:hypothetical protein